ncbi:MAG: hypothetical protein HY747_10835 [Elusimicrobia bacterium]|nr:hypothetical protein [Elusimicrobiota bacterium]
MNLFVWLIMIAASAPCSAATAIRFGKVESQPQSVDQGGGFVISASFVNGGRGALKKESLAVYALFINSSGVAYHKTNLIHAAKSVPAGGRVSFRIPVRKIPEGCAGECYFRVYLAVDGELIAKSKLGTVHVNSAGEPEESTEPDVKFDPKVPTSAPKPEVPAEVIEQPRSIINAAAQINRSETMQEGRQVSPRESARALFSPVKRDGLGKLDLGKLDWLRQRYGLKVALAYSGKASNSGILIWKERAEEERIEPGGFYVSASMVSPGYAAAYDKDTIGKYGFKLGWWGKNIGIAFDYSSAEGSGTSYYATYFSPIYTWVAPWGWIITGYDVNRYQLKQTEKTKVYSFSILGRYPLSEGWVSPYAGVGGAIVSSERIWQYDSYKNGVLRYHYSGTFPSDDEFAPLFPVGISLGIPNFRVFGEWRYLYTDKSQLEHQWEAGLSVGW